MKNKVIVVLMLVVMAVVASSCFTSRSKYGCPANPQASTRYRG